MFFLFQVNINISEAQKLVGVNMNPVVFIRMGGQKRHTATQKATNCPFYNEVESLTQSLTQSLTHYTLTQ